MRHREGCKGPHLNPGETAIPAGEVRKGDIVLAATIELNGHTDRLDHATPYTADPRPDKTGCGCAGHRSLTAEDRATPLVVLYDGPIWDGACDAVPADTLVIIRERAEERPTLPREQSGMDVLRGLLRL
ncbi:MULTISPECIES: hypothetical protein [Streptomyces]|uniref:Uncharacterized protein n=1 Tax=Streptomyces canarius TaxID=285453 RepID=A0ABQ3CFA4_9ACTN|nr:hypothetical protein [Streptomyces canarius]GHA08892.1 hypothetical protein GCM10010345_11590 [Streptomyces canarius]